MCIILARVEQFHGHIFTTQRGIWTFTTNQHSQGSKKCSACTSTWTANARAIYWACVASKDGCKRATIQLRFTQPRRVEKINCFDHGKLEGNTLAASRTKNPHIVQNNLHSSWTLCRRKAHPPVRVETYITHTRTWQNTFTVFERQD